MIASLGDTYGIDPVAFEKTGALDPILGINTRLFIDPSLLKHTDVPELLHSHKRVTEHFTNVIRLVLQIRKEGDALWRAADKMLTFPEMDGLCIGYSNGTAGKGAGPKKRRALLSTIMEIVQAGSEDPTIFDLVGAFEEGIGPDLISDMVAKIIMPDLIAFTQRVCSDLGIPMEPRYFTKGAPAEDLPKNPLNDSTVILVPKQILRDLPVAESFGDIGWIVEHNEKLRHELNGIFGTALRSLSAAEKKARVKDAFVAHPEVLKGVLLAYQNNKPQFYDFKDDPSGEVVWYRVSKSFAESGVLTLPSNPSLDEVYEVVKAICLRFQKDIEDNQLCRLLYDKREHRKHESAAQLIFFGIANAYCEANNLDLSPESDSGRGPVDFKISSGFNGRVLVEVKLTSNPALQHGYEKQLPIYQQAESATKGILLVIDNGGISERRFQAFRELVAKAGDTGPEVIYVDGLIRQSASKADE